MDSELKTRISQIVFALATQEQGRLQAAGTFVELEELACQIGDEVTRQLMSQELVQRCNQMAEEPTAFCPDCQKAGSQVDPEHRQLASTRGEMSYHEPAYYCRSCRRSFFPGGGKDGIAGAGDRDTQDDSTHGLVGKQSG